MFDLSLLSGAQPEPTVIFLMGPTASGKTALAVEWAQRFPVDIISVDSAMVYRGMDIGTAKPSPAILARAPHRLIDMCAPHQPYSAGQFRHDALREIADIVAKGRIPLLVGGTMLYFRALEGLAALPTADPTVRAAIAAEMTEKGVPALHAQLATIDPIAADRIHPCDAQRIQRALEVHTLTGQSLTTLHAAQETEQLPFRVVKWVVMPTDRRLLHERIARRFGEMLEQGFVAEVETLRARGDLTADMPSMRAVGYRQAWAYLDGLMTYREMVERAIIATRQLAKRQCTWLRGENLHQR